MSFWIMMLIMLVSGLIGGTVNFLLPSNTTEDGQFKDPWWKAVVLGLGATLLVPLFLEIAQSKLLDGVHVGKPKDTALAVAEKPLPSRDTVMITHTVDSSRRLLKADTSRKPYKAPPSVGQMAVMPGPGKSYLLYLAYCILAAAAGFRFIQMLLKNVVKEEQLEAARTETKNLKENQQLKNQQDLIEAQKDEVKAKERFVQSTISTLPDNVQPANLKEVLGTIQPLILKAVTNPDDPQKGRFGGKPAHNGRQLKATVGETGIPEFFEVTFWVESVPGTAPLDKPILYYIHPTFHPSVFTLTPDRFTAGKALYKVTAWGAFTIGAITDDGRTLLELDLAEDASFPAKFRSR